MFTSAECRLYGRLDSRTHARFSLPGSSLGGDVGDGVVCVSPSLKMYLSSRVPKKCLKFFRVVEAPSPPVTTMTSGGLGRAELDAFEEVLEFVVRGWGVSTR